MLNFDQIINQISHGSMKSLNLRNNQIGSERAIQLAEALKVTQKKRQNTLIMMKDYLKKFNNQKIKDIEIINCCKNKKK